MEYSMNEVLLTANNVGLSFGDKVVLKDVNFSIKNIVRPGMTQGQVVSLIGRSGIGKTQLLRIMSGLMKPTVGDVKVNAGQEEVTYGDMGIVPQDYYLFPWRKIGKILDLAARKNPLLQDKNIRKEAIDNYVAAFELSEHLNKYPAQLSGGQKQRVSISQQLLNGSNFLLMDEPFSGLDSIMIDKTTNILTRISQADELKTIIIVSHDLVNSVALSDTVFLLSKQGRAPEEGATIIQEISLIERDLAWHPEIKQMPAFHNTIAEIKSLL